MLGLVSQQQAAALSHYRSNSLSASVISSSVLEFNSSKTDARISFIRFFTDNGTFPRGRSPTLPLVTKDGFPLSPCPCSLSGTYSPNPLSVSPYPPRNVSLCMETAPDRVSGVSLEFWVSLPFC